MKEVIFSIILFLTGITLATDFSLSYDTNWPNRSDDLCSITPSMDVYYKQISSPISNTHLVGVDSEVLSNGNYIVLSQIYSSMGGSSTNPSRYYLSVIDESDGDELDNYYSTNLSLGYTEVFDIEKIPNETNSFLIVGKDVFVVLGIPTSTTYYRVLVKKITVSASNVISVAWSQAINSDTTDKAGYSVAINDGKVYIGGNSGAYGVVLKADLTSTGLTNITTLYSATRLGIIQNSVINKVKFDEDLDSLLIAGGYNWVRFALPSSTSGSVSFIYELDESNGSIVSNYTRSDVYDDQINIANFAYNYASDMLMFSEVENGAYRLYDVKYPFESTRVVSLKSNEYSPRNMDTIYHLDDDAVFVDIDRFYTHLRVDKNLDADFEDTVDQSDTDTDSVWFCNGVLRGTAGIRNANIKIIDNDEILSVGAVLEEDSDYFKLFVQKRFYN